MGKHFIHILPIAGLLLLTGCLDEGMKTSDVSNQPSSQGSPSTTVQITTTTLPPTTTTQAPTTTTQSQIPAGAINVKDKGAVGNGVTDDTTAIQNAVNAVTTGGTVYVPAGKYMINAAKFVQLKSNMHFMMHKDAILAAIPNALERHTVISINGVTNVQVSGGRLLGERDQHMGTTGEWGYGIKVGTGASKVSIHDIHISDFWGDGVCIGGYAKDVEIRRIVSTRNRRQGLSITRSENIRVYDSEFSYTEGTAPQYGIDIEPDPNPNGYYARNIIIQGNKIHNNRGGGIQAYKQVYNVLIKDNQISYNSYGVYTVEAFDGTISGNLFAHNRYQGVAIRARTERYEVSNNTFRNNHTALLGFTNDTNPLVSMTGVVSGSSGTASHINLTTDGTIVDIKVLTNLYAK